MICLRAMLFFILLTIHTAHAFDPKATDVLSLRLGMGEAEVTAKLSEQGFAGPTFRRDYQPCRLDAAARCLVSLSTRTLDGRVVVEFDRPSASGPDRVTAIAYLLDAKRPGEPEAITISVVERYGPPDIAHPMTWCDRPTGIGPCSPHRAHMTLQGEAGAPLVLRLTEKSPTGMGSR